MNSATPARIQPSVGRVIPFPARPRETVALSAQERACLELAAKGHDPGESSRLLSASEATFVSEETVRSTQMRARHKLKARSLTHAVAIGLARGLIELRG
jgi:DNA-binding CsgD family transcriptional regulator